MGFGLQISIPIFFIIKKFGTIFGFDPIFYFVKIEACVIIF